MKVARLHSINDIRLHEEPIPTPGPDETLVRVKAVGLCGSDLHWFSEAGIGDAQLSKPLVLGHEFAGVTEAGQRVAVDPAMPCGKCEPCLAGNPNLCLHIRFAGHGEDDGALRDMLAWQTRHLISLPDSLNEVDGAMLEPLGVALHAIDLGKIRPGMRVGVFGCGPIGLLVLQLARIAGATDVFISEPIELIALMLEGALVARPGQPMCKWMWLLNVQERTRRWRMPSWLPNQEDVSSSSAFQVMTTPHLLLPSRVVKV